MFNGKNILIKCFVLLALFCVNCSNKAGHSDIDILLEETFYAIKTGGSSPKTSTTLKKQPVKAKPEKAEKIKKPNYDQPLTSNWNFQKKFNMILV